MPLVPPGRPEATFRDRCLLGIQLGTISGGIGAIFRGIMAPVAPLCPRSGQRRQGALVMGRGSLDWQLASGWRRWPLRQQVQARFLADVLQLKQNPSTQVQ